MRRFLPLIFSIFFVISFPEMSLAHAIERKSFIVGKTKVIEVLQRDSQGRILRRSLITPELTEISFYDPKTTAPTAWIVKNAEQEIEAKYPIDGVFRRLQVKKRKDNSEDRFVFFYNTQTASYRLADAENVPDKIYQRAFDDVHITRGIDRCRAVKDLRTPFEEIADLLEQARDEEKFLKLLNESDATSRLFDRSCLESTSSTLSDPEDMARTKEALAEIMGSPLKDKPSRYLKCMTDQGLSLHAARIEAIVIGAVEHSTNVLNRRRSLITCEPNMISRELAHYNVTNGQINITRRPAQMVPELVVPKIFDTASGSSPQLPASLVRQNHIKKEIGKTLFHELIHASGIEEENFVEDITLCCGDGFDSGSQSCQRMKAEVDRLERVQTAELLLKGGEWPWYNRLQKHLTHGDVTAESKRAFDKAFAAEFDKEWTKSRKWGPECYESPEAQIECNTKFGDQFREAIQKKAVSLCLSKITLKKEPPTKEEFCRRIEMPINLPRDELSEDAKRAAEIAKAARFGSLMNEPARQPSFGSGSAPKPTPISDAGSAIVGPAMSSKIPARFEVDLDRTSPSTRQPSREQPATLELPGDLHLGTRWHGSERNEFAGRALRDNSGSFVSPLGLPRPDLQRDIERPRQLIETMSKLADRVGLTIPQARADSTVNQGNLGGSTSGGRTPASEPSAEASVASQGEKPRGNSQAALSQTSSSRSSSVRSGRSSSGSSRLDEKDRPKRKRKKKDKENLEDSPTALRVSSSDPGFVPEVSTRAGSGSSSVQLMTTIENRPEAVQDLLKSRRFHESLIRNKILLIDADQREYGARDPVHIYRYNSRTRKYEKETTSSSEDSP